MSPFLGVDQCPYITYILLCFMLSSIYTAWSWHTSVLWHCWLGGRKGIRPVKTEQWVAGVVICLEWGADLHMAQLTPLPLIVSCFSKILIGFTFPWYQLTWVVPAKGPLNGCVSVWSWYTSKIICRLHWRQSTVSVKVMAPFPHMKHNNKVLLSYCFDTARHRKFATL